MFSQRCQKSYHRDGSSSRIGRVLNSSRCVNAVVNRYNYVAAISLDVAIECIPHHHFVSGRRGHARSSFSRFAFCMDWSTSHATRHGERLTMCCLCMVMMWLRFFNTMTVFSAGSDRSSLLHVTECGLCFRLTIIPWSGWPVCVCVHMCNSMLLMRGNLQHSLHVHPPSQHHGWTWGVRCAT
jgi:hypothetical protein